MQRLRLKAKEKGKYLYRELEVCTKQAQLDAYLSELCAKLKCCSKMLLKSSELSSSNNAMLINCTNINCCQLCTVNYHSISLEYLVNAEPSAKVASFLNSTGGKKASLAIRAALSNPKLKSAHLKSGVNNFSPIKTRFNVRQNLLATVRLEEERKHVEESSGKKKRSSALIAVESKLEPMVKKQKRLKLMESDEAKRRRRKESGVKTEKNFIYFKPSVQSDVGRKAATGQSSLISSAGKSSADGINGAICAGNNGIKGGVLNAGLNGAGGWIALSSNPIFWSAKDVCKYLTENKFDPSLVYLIEEHVSFF